MLRGLYTAAAGMMATELATDALANNLSNVNTLAYKGSKVNYQTFPEMMMQRINNKEQQQIGSLTTGSKVYETFVDFAAGPIKQTGNTFDMAIQGQGFFTVRKGAGEPYYTRAGNFTINENGFLATIDGSLVQGKLGNIQLMQDGGPFSVNPNGEIVGRTGVIDQLQIARFQDENTLQKAGGNLFQATPNSRMIPAPLAGEPLGYKINSGSLEDSNVNPVAELVNNIQGLRLYEALQKNIHFHNDTLGKAVNDVGRPR